MSYLKYVNNVLVNSKTCSWLIDTNTYLQRSNFPTAIYLFKQQWKHQNIVWNLFKVNNEDTRTKLMTSFFVFIVNFKHISHIVLCGKSWLWQSKYGLGD